MDDGRLKLLQLLQEPPPALAKPYGWAKNRHARQMVKTNHHATLGSVFLNHPRRRKFRVKVTDQDRLAIDYLFDQEYEEAIGVASPGINGRVGAGFNFYLSRQAWNSRDDNRS